MSENQQTQSRLGRDGCGAVVLQASNFQSLGARSAIRGSPGRHASTTVNNALKRKFPASQQSRRNILSLVPLPTFLMAPTAKAKASSSEPKQKSLMGWLSKPAAGTPKTASKRPRVASRPEASSSPGRESDFQTPASNKGATVSNATYTKSSDGNTFDDTPPTSDPVSIDVDLLSDDDKPKAPVRGFGDIRIKSTEFAQKRLKRKAVLEDSDEELGGAIDAIAYKKGLSAYRPSPEPEGAGRTKKPRVSVPPSDEDEEEIGESSFASRLSRFKKSPKKKGPHTDAQSSYIRLTVTDSAFCKVRR